MVEYFKCFSRCEKGATAIEYGLIASLIAVVIIGALKSTGDGTGGLYDALDKVSNAIMAVF